MFYPEIFNEDLKKYSYLLYHSASIISEVRETFMNNVAKFMEGDDLRQTYIDRFWKTFDNYYFEYYVDDESFTDYVDFMTARFRRIFLTYQKIFEDRIKGYYNVYNLNDIMQGYKHTKTKTGNITDDNQKVTTTSNSQAASNNYTSSISNSDTGSASKTDYDLPQVLINSSDYGDTNGNASYKNNTTHNNLISNNEMSSNNGSVNNIGNSRDEIDNVRTYIETNTDYDADIIEVWNKYDKYVKDIIKEFVEKFKPCFRLILL